LLKIHAQALSPLANAKVSFNVASEPALDELNEYSSPIFPCDRQFVGVEPTENGVSIVTRDATKNPRAIAASTKTVNLKKGTSSRKAAQIASTAASKTRPDLRSVRLPTI